MPAWASLAARRRAWRSSACSTPARTSPTGSGADRPGCVPRPAGVLLGLLLLVVPQMYGVGYPVLERAVGGHYVILALLGLLAAKILATSLTMWIGGSGGVFAPSLFIGAMLGSAYGAVAHRLLPGLAAAAGAYGLVGMGAVFAATARAPITAVIIIFELTGDYRIILPLMFAIVVATALSNRSPRTPSTPSSSAAAGSTSTRPHTEPNGPDHRRRRDGPDPRGARTRPAVATRSSSGSRPSEPTRSQSADDGSLAGVIGASDLERALGHRTDSTTLRPRGPRSATTRSRTPSRPRVHRRRGLPVIDEDDQLVGWITHRHVLRTYLRRFGAPEDNARKPGPPLLAAAEQLPAHRRLPIDSTTARAVRLIRQRSFSVASAGHPAFELQFTHVDGHAGARRLRRVHRAECFGSRAHVLGCIDSCSTTAVPWASSNRS